MPSHSGLGMFERLIWEISSQFKLCQINQDSQIAAATSVETAILSQRIIKRALGMRLKNLLKLRRINSLVRVVRNLPWPW